MRRIAFGLVVTLIGCGSAGEMDGDGETAPDDTSGAGAGTPASTAASGDASSTASGTGAGGEDPGPKPTPARIPPGAWVAIEPGTFTMGAPASESCFTSDNQHVHTVRVWV